MEATAATESDRSPEARPSRRLRQRLSVVGQRLGLVPGPPGENVYHGFISYSHQADAALALALQRGLHRFAKPWYQARALHVFRDEAALSANPDLWGSVRQALDCTQYYILLASPQAAQSEWVSREAQYWLDEKEGLDRVLIVLTAGELSFDGGPIAPEQNALPSPLQQAFEREPRYIDLRWAKSAEDLSLSHPRFRDAVAEIASPLHGKPKEEISSEEVKQHRRTRRVARGAALSLVTLLAAAIVAAIVAYSQYQSAHARSLAAEATADLSSNPEHSVALALQSTQISASGTDVSSLRAALTQSPLRMVINSGAGSSAQAAWNPKIDEVAVSGPGDTVALWDPRTGKLERTLHGADHQPPPAYPPTARCSTARTERGSRTSTSAGWCRCGTREPGRLRRGIGSRMRSRRPRPNRIRSPRSSGGTAISSWCQGRDWTASWHTPPAPGGQNRGESARGRDVDVSQP